MWKEVMDVLIQRWPHFFQEGMKTLGLHMVTESIKSKCQPQIISQMMLLVYYNRNGNTPEIWLQTLQPWFPLHILVPTLMSK